jgi:ribose-phosphate pyrophosphokinase
MIPLVIPMPGNEALATTLARHLHGDVGAFETRAFPDDETYLRIQQDPRGRSVILVCTMDHPNAKFLPLILLLTTRRTWVRSRSASSLHTFVICGRTSVSAMVRP